MVRPQRSSGIGRRSINLRAWIRSPSRGSPPPTRTWAARSRCPRCRCRSRAGSRSHAAGDGAVEVEWNLDDTRDGAPGRLALYAGAAPPPHAAARRPRPSRSCSAAASSTHRTAPLDEAQPSLRPVHELRWEDGGLHLRLTAQGPWRLDDLLAIASSVEP